ncbi:MAG: AAA family ATPase [Pseudomonadota bacterium]
MAGMTEGRIVSFINMKGGVGKTTSSITLAETSASEYGWKVLVVDLDAQASASYAVLGPERYEEEVAAERTLAHFFDAVAETGQPQRPLAGYVAHVAHVDYDGGAGAPIDVICAEPGLRYTERALIERYYRLRMKRVVTASAPEGQTRRIMREGLGGLREIYDLIVIDCPPGISLFAEAGVACSDLIVLPTIPDYLSTLGLKELNRKFLRQLRRDGNLSGRTAILPTKVRRGDATHTAYLKKLDAMVRTGEIEAAFLDSMIAQSADIARALDDEHLGESFKDKYGNVREDLIEFASEIRGLLEDGLANAA